MKEGLVQVTFTCLIHPTTVKTVLKGFKDVDVGWEEVYRKCMEPRNMQRYLVWCCVDFDHIEELGRRSDLGQVDGWEYIEWTVEDMV